MATSNNLDSSISSNEDVERSKLPQETKNLEANEVEENNNLEPEEDVFGNLEKLFQATKFDDANEGHSGFKPKRRNPFQKRKAPSCRSCKSGGRGSCHEMSSGYKTGSSSIGKSQEGKNLNHL